MAARRAILILILTLLVKSYYCQTFLDTLIYSRDTTLLDLKVDKLNNKWLFFENRIIRVSPEKSYNDTLDNLNLRQLSLDLNTPLKNLFYFRHKNTIEIKNSRWGVISNIKLDPLHIFEPAFVKFTVDKMIWVLDVSENILYKLNENGVKISQKRNPFKVNGQFYFPTEVVQIKNYTLAIDTSYGIFILDDYGNLVQSKKMGSCQGIFEYKGNAYLNKQNYLFQFQTKHTGEIDMTNPKRIEFSSPVISLQVFNENALILFRNKRIYELKNFENLFE
jgi:hypothetical protein